MKKRVPHDRLFKELLGTFLMEFLCLFLPELAERIVPGSLVLMGEKELLLPGETTRRADLVARTRIRGVGKEAFFLIHLEHEAQNKNPLDFPRRMLRYTLHLYDSTGLSVYPIALLSYPKPKRQLSDKFEIVGPDCHRVLFFNYRVVQLNRMEWRDYARNLNPVAVALMSRMNIASGERPLVKLECLRLLRRLKLGVDQSTQVAKFFENYLQLDEGEVEQFRDEFSKISPKEQVEMAEFITSWHEAGRKEERQRTEQERQRAEQAERERDVERQRAEQERRRAELLAARLRELGVDPEAIGSLRIDE